MRYLPGLLYTRSQQLRALPPFLAPILAKGMCSTHLTRLCQCGATGKHKQVLTQQGTETHTTAQSGLSQILSVYITLTLCLSLRFFLYKSLHALSLSDSFCV